MGDIRINRVPKFSYLRTVKKIYLRFLGSIMREDGLENLTIIGLSEGKWDEGKLVQMKEQGFGDIAKNKSLTK